MRQLVVAALVTCGLVVPAVARQGVPLSAPDLSPPAGAKQISSGAYNIPITAGRPPTSPVPPTPADFARPSGGSHARLQTTLTVDAITEHYLQQLKAAGWKAALTQIQPAWAFVRLSGGSESDKLVGALTVLPFPDQQNVLVAIDLVRAGAAWRGLGRTGGGGAGATSGFALSIFDFTDSERPFLTSLTLPPQVTRVERRDGGGGRDISHEGVRLETFLSPAALMKILESEVIAGGWQVGARAGDAVQAVTHFTPPPGGDSRAVLALTMMPGTHEMDFSLNVIRNR